MWRSKEHFGLRLHVLHTADDAHCRIQRKQTALHILQRAEHDGRFDEAGALEDQILAIAGKYFAGLRIPDGAADGAAVLFFQLADGVMERHGDPSFVFFYYYATPHASHKAQVGKTINF